jgi:hypothetical protein
MTVHCFLRYCSSTEPRGKDEKYWATIKIKKIFKGERINGNFRVNFDGQERIYTDLDRATVIDHVAHFIARKIELISEGPICIVPIPGHATVKAGAADYRNFSYASLIASKIRDERATAVPALHWVEEQEPQRGATGHRSVLSRYSPMRVSVVPAGPIILFDDVVTSGSSLLAAERRLSEAGATVMAAIAVARANQDESPLLGWSTEEVTDDQAFFDLGPSS